MVFRITDLAMEISPKVRILGSDGTTVLEEHTIIPDDEEYFFTLLDGGKGNVFYIQILRPQQTGG